MKQFGFKLLIKLYPQAWQERYSEEYLALLEETDLRWYDYFDSLLGAFDAHLHPEWVDSGRFPMNSQRALRLAGIGALLSALLLVLGLLNASRISESATEYLLILAPVMLLPLVVVLHRLYRPFAPRLSLITAVIGISSMTTFLAASIFGFVSTSIGFNPQPVSIAWLFQLIIAGLGVWMILAAYLGRQTNTLPGGLPWMIGTSGLGWTAMFVGIMIASQGTNSLIARYAPIMGAGFVIWLMTHFVWTIWLGIWIWQKPEMPIYNTQEELAKA